MSISVRSTHLNLISAGEIRAKWSASGSRVLSYYLDLQHKGLGVHKQVSAPELDILQRKVNVLVEGWDKRYAAQESKGNAASQRRAAEQLGAEAEARRQSIRGMLKATLSVDDSVNWDQLKRRDRYQVAAFPKLSPSEPSKPLTPIHQQVKFLDKLFGRRERIERENAEADAKYARTIESINQDYQSKIDAWRKEKNAWEAVQKEKEQEFKRELDTENQKVDQLKEAWQAGEPHAVIEHANMVLERSSYDPVVPKDYSVHYDPAQKVMVVEYRLPAPDDLPSTKSVKVSPTTGEIKETFISQKDHKTLFDDLCYQVCLRTIHELFEADAPNNINSIVFNGTCEAVDRSTGHMVESTILSIRAERDEFLSINLASIEPRECFKRLKGVAAASLSGLSPVPPLLTLDRNDQRFIEGRSVELPDDGGINLAAMGWEDFEHLVRELFEKEFAARGGEVRVTQASSDGGVDAIAFDPDPISGGKIVIQAKRYTKTVGVAAVRDLYGTVMNEGANKGILVTTSDFGPDAYSFAAGKPLTLMGGSNLLYLLEKHGQKARINLRDARRELGLR